MDDVATNPNLETALLTILRASEHDVRLHLDHLLRQLDVRVEWIVDLNERLARVCAVLRQQHNEIATIVERRLRRRRATELRSLACELALKDAPRSVALLEEAMRLDAPIFFPETPETPGP